MRCDFLVDPVVSGQLCLTLLHSIWVVGLLALLARIADRLVGQKAVQRSYAIHLAALTIAIFALPVTYWLMTPPVEIAAMAETPSAATVPPHAAEPVCSMPPGAEAPFETTAAALPPVTPPAFQVIVLEPAEAASKRDLWPIAATWLATAYALGVACMLLRLIRGIWRAHRLGARAKILRDGPLVNLLRTLAEQWSMRVVPTLAQAEQIITPKVVGLLRPTVLLPTSAVTGLSTDELELILAHELAHIRRYDMWVNLVQRLVEALLFFNPALWYLSRRISLLREYCCDEAACAGAAGHSQVRYAQALLRAVELAGSGRDQAELATLAATTRTPSQLRRRVARLFGEPLAESIRFSRGGLILGGVLAVLLLVGPTWYTSAKAPGDSVSTQDGDDGASPSEPDATSDTNPTPAVNTTERDPKEAPPSADPGTSDNTATDPEFDRFLDEVIPGSDANTALIQSGTAGTAMVEAKTVLDRFVKGRDKLRSGVFIANGTMDKSVSKSRSVGPVEIFSAFDYGKDRLRFDRLWTTRSAPLGDAPPAPTLRPSEHGGKFVRLPDRLIRYRISGNGVVDITPPDYGAPANVFPFDVRAIGLCCWLTLSQGHSCQDIVDRFAPYLVSHERDANGMHTLSWLCDEYKSRWIVEFDSSKDYVPVRYQLFVRKKKSQLPDEYPLIKSVGVTWKQMDGVWLPHSCSFRQEGPFPGQQDLQFTWQSVNQPVEASLFTVAGMDLPDGTWVSDVRQGPEVAVASPEAEEDEATSAPKITTYPVNKKVSDFPAADDFSTPEAAYATINRKWADGPLDWNSVSCRRTRDSFRPGESFTTPRPSDEEAAIMRGTEILEVRIYDKTFAQVAARWQRKNRPIDLRSFELDDGRWLNAGNDAVETIDEAATNFKRLVKWREQHKNDPPHRAGDIVLAEPKDVPLSKEKLDLMGRVEWVLMHNGRDVTARKTIEWGDVEKHANGNRSIRYKFQATIWDRDQMIMNIVFTFDPDGKVVGMKQVEGFPKKVDNKAKSKVTISSGDNSLTAESITFESDSGSWRITAGDPSVARKSRKADATSVEFVSPADAKQTADER